MPGTYIPSDYLPILIFMIIATAFGLGTLVVGSLFRPHRPYGEKLEAVFLYPWAIVFDKIGLYAFIEMVIFIVILFVGYIYAWRKDAFTWE
jgi:NADH-quinone oxidoreductase subunit A